MNQRGTLADFLICKIGVAIAVLLLLGAVLTMASSSKRGAEKEELALVADAISSTIRSAEALPGEAEIQRKLPAPPQQIEVTIVGTRSNGAQVIRVIVGSEQRVERTLMLATEVNGGEFMLACGDPSAIRLSKAGSIRLELA